jgi:hypothetical protein
MKLSLEDENEALKYRIAILKDLVEDAYVEGWIDYGSVPGHVTKESFNQLWEVSRTAGRLELVDDVVFIDDEEPAVEAPDAR